MIDDPRDRAEARIVCAGKCKHGEYRLKCVHCSVDFRQQSLKKFTTSELEKEVNRRKGNT